ncbi:KleE stable inheritance protein [Burkholderia aenigmatica]|uniref:KleE stable inheritance protein n=1 Tax=Burkholderia aenigmatica TaxID=2015348 RepID=UPI00264DDBBD|nr:KleE stable inheritance protein [Burkholderia aenigmatica]MDN7880079.1 KleE stable inheritance protein [Burkholderia aenigmatica]
MTNVVPFPKRAGANAGPAVGAAHKPNVDHVKVRSFASKVLYGFLVVVGAFWPLLRWVLAIDVFFKFVLMLWYWDTPGAHAGWVFAAHMAVFSGLTLLLASHKPQS